jgi:hypothetical protein
LNCSDDSSLSDVSIDDPSLVRPEIIVSKDIDTTGTVSSTIQAWLYDKNNDLIELKNGGITVNGIQMSIGKTLVNKAPYYYIPQTQLDFKLDSTYTFIITLGNGSTYSSSIKTHDKNLHTFNVPKEHNKNQDLPVNWLEIDNRYPMKIIFDAEADTSATPYETIEIPASDRDLGSYTISYTKFNNPPDIRSVELKLISEKDGAVNSSFMTGSKITSRLSIKKKVKVN